MFKMFKPCNGFAPFKTFKTFNRCAQFKPFKTDSVPDIGPFKVQRETGLLHGVPIVSVVPVVPVDPMVPEFQFEIPFAPWRLCERNDFFVSFVCFFENCVMQKRGVYIRFLPLDGEGRRKG
jgi:hypothetical protein